MPEKKERKTIKSDPAYVMYKRGITINKGNFESVKFELSVTLPCEMDEVDSIVDHLKERVDDRLAQYEEQERNPSGPKDDVDLML
jgi:hypothetical protein